MFATAIASSQFRPIGGSHAIAGFGRCVAQYATASFFDALPSLLWARAYAVAWRRGAGEQTFLAPTLLAASVRWLEADDAARLRPAYMSVEDVGVRVEDNLSVIDPFPLLHLPNPNVPVALADFGLRGFAITRFLAVLLDASIAAGSVRVPWHLPLGVKVLMERVVMFCLVMFGLVLRSRSRG